MISNGCFLTLLIATAFAVTEPKQQLPDVLVSASLEDRDKQHFFEVFDGYDKTSVKETHFAVLGNLAFGRETVGVSCSFLSPHFSSDNLETQYYALSTSSHIKGCSPKIPNESHFVDLLEKSTLTPEQLYYFVHSATIAKVQVDKSGILKQLKELSAKERNPSGLSFILSSVAKLNGTTPKDLEPFAPLVKELIAQADEMDGTALFFERGAYATAFAVESIFEFSIAMKKAPAITEQQIIKFSNFLYERRMAHQIRTASHIASVLQLLSSNQFMTLVVFHGKFANERAGVSGILVPESRVVHLRVTDVLGSPLKASTLQAGSLYQISESTEPLLVGPISNGNFRESSGGLFTIDLKVNGTPVSSGRYLLEVTVKPKQKNAVSNLVGVSNTKIPLRVVSPVRIESAQFKLSDPSNVVIESPVTFPEKFKPSPGAAGSASGAVRVHQQSQIRVQFKLTDGVTGVKLTPHQVFMHLTHQTTRQSIAYVCKQYNEGMYAFRLNVDGAADDFDRLSGVYAMELIVGDALLVAPVVWHLADVDLQLPHHDERVSESYEDVARLTVASVAGRKRVNSPPHPLIGEGPKSAKPELEHTFRLPEPRPSDWFALAFTGLCCTPIAILLIAWPIVGCNLRNFPCTLSAPLFHAGLGGIFALYLLYWFKLDMFTTLRYLLFVGLFTFFFGNRLLRHLASQRPVC